ncbi:MAG TPA: 30S ribosomal protein S8 [Verrucomicrobiales bacterium]|nr:30S ribosomal protein S8 [Verrucomicrobiales bacterium]
MDPIADMLSRIRNAQQALLPKVTMPHSKLKENIARILQAEGYVVDYSTSGDKIKTLSVTLKYAGRRGVIEGLRRISRPGIRHYASSTELPRVRGGLGVAIMTTSRGVMSAREARKQNVGGEVLCFVW